VFILIIKNKNGEERRENFSGAKTSSSLKVMGSKTETENKPEELSHICKEKNSKLNCSSGYV